MSIEEKVKEVEAVFNRLDAAISRFQSGSSLYCPPGCGKCCFKADIEATILEFLPFALHVYNEGKAEAWYEKLKTTESSICLILNPQQSGAGLCSDYQYRGLICRLFGYSARTNKYGKRELVTCHVVKTEQQESYEKASLEVEAGGDIPVMNEYYMQLLGIDADLTRDFYPINQAMRRALETVMQYYAYR
jgi:Fe-S-cluster containining protein